MFKALSPRAVLIAAVVALVASSSALLLLGVTRGGIPRLLAPVGWRDFASLAAAVVFCGAFGFLASALGRWEDASLERMRKQIGTTFVGVTSVFGSAGQWAAILLSLWLLYRVGLAGAVAAGWTDGDVMRILLPDSFSCLSIVYSPNSETFVLVDYDSAYAHRAADGQRIWSLPHARSEIERAVFSSDGRTFVVEYHRSDEVFGKEPRGEPPHRQWDTATWSELDVDRPVPAYYDPTVHGDGMRRLELVEGRLLLHGADGASMRFPEADYGNVEVDHFGFCADGARAFVAYRREGLNIDFWNPDTLKRDGHIHRGTNPFVWSVSPDLSHAVLHEPYDVTVWRLPQLQSR